MNLKIAKQFVADFVKGDYTPEEYAAFLRWLKGAKAEELNEVAEMHESMYEHWDVAGLAPAEGWMDRLESKLDQLEEVPVRVIGENWFVRRRGWVAAASVAVVIAGGALFFLQHKDVKTDSIRQDVPVLAKAAENPVGGENKQVVLPDGSKVLLNVASTLRYPDTFGGTERVVELSGEAYFEIMPDASKPFRVLIKDAEVDVLGTSFNVSAYKDEPVCKTTLIDGSVKIESRSDNKTLTPGQQGIITYASTGDIAIVPRVDVGDVMAWKKGYFRFTNEEFQVVARVLSRYYNVEIQCDHNVAIKTLSGSVSRDKGLQGNLDQFQNFKYNWDGTKVKVTL